MISIVDYGRGNIYSICAALRQCGADFQLSDDPDQIATADRILFPGVGAFGDAAKKLKSAGTWEALKEAAGRGQPILGICVGMQILAERGEEFGDHEGLGLVNGVTRRLPNPTGDATSTRIPNVGWRPLRLRSAHPVLARTAEGVMMYFVHSYALQPANPAANIATIACNGQDVCAVVAEGSVVGCQFHPERSGPAGLDLLQEFVQWKP